MVACILWIVMDHGRSLVELQNRCHVFKTVYLQDWCNFVNLSHWCMSENSQILRKLQNYWFILHSAFLLATFYSDSFCTSLHKVCRKVLQRCPPSVSEALLHQWRVISCSVWPQEDEAAWPHGCHPTFPPEWLCQVSNALGLESLCITAAHQRRNGSRVCT